MNLRFSNLQNKNKIPVIAPVSNWSSMALVTKRCEHPSASNAGGVVKVKDAGVPNASLGWPRCGPCPPPHKKRKSLPCGGAKTGNPRRVPVSNGENSK